MPMSSSSPHRSSGRCARCPARHKGLCGAVSPATVEALALRGHQASYAKGKPFVDQGTPGDRVGIVVSGLAKAVHVTEDGDEFVLNIHRAGDLVGDPFGTENHVSWEAATDVTVCWLSAASLDQLLSDHPDLQRAYLQTVSHQMGDQQLWCANLRGRSTVERLAFWLVDQALYGDHSENGVVPLELSRRDLASLLDMSTETLCRSLYHLVDKGAIEMLAPDCVGITDPAMLRDLAHCELDRPLDRMTPAGKRPTCAA